MAAKEDIYIKEGQILRGGEATQELYAEDVKEVIQDAGLESALKKSSQESVSPSVAEGIPERVDDNVDTLVDEICKKAGPRAIINLKAMNASVKVVNVDARYSVTATAEAVNAKLCNASVTGGNIAVCASASATAKVVDAKVGNLDATAAKCAIEAEAVAAVKGADVKAANAQFTGVQVTAKAEAQAKALGIDVNAASVQGVGYMVHRGAGVCAEAKGLDVKAATANFVGKEDKDEITGHVETVGGEIRAANVAFTGEKKGESVSATVKAQGAEVKVANVNIQGKDSSIGAQATLQACSASVRAANVDISPQGGTHFQATADFSLGIDAGNVHMGTHKGGGIGISTRVQVGNVGFAAGPPSLNIAPGFNLGLGGGSSSSGSGRKGGSSGGNAGGSGQHSNDYTTDGGSNIGPTGQRGVGTMLHMAGGDRTGNGPSHHAIGGENRASSRSTHVSTSGSSFPNTHGGTNTGKSNGSHNSEYTTSAGLREPSNSMPYSGATFGSSYTGRSSIDSHSSSRVSKASSINKRVAAENGPPRNCARKAFKSDTEPGVEKRVSQYTQATGCSHALSHDDIGVSGRMQNSDGSILRRRTMQPKTLPETNSGCMIGTGSKDTHATTQSPSGNRRFLVNGAMSGSTTNAALGSQQRNAHKHPDTGACEGGEIPGKCQVHKQTTSQRTKHEPENGGSCASSTDTEAISVAKSGFGTTSRRADSTSKSYKSNGDKSIDSAKWDSRSERGLPAANSKDQTYGQGLATLLSKKVKHLKPDKPKDKSKSKSVKAEIPSSREEAKRELKNRMRNLKRDIDEAEEEIQSCASGKAAAGGSAKVGHSAQQSEGLESGEDGETDTNGPSKKPFGSKGNIYTLGCFQNESSKQVKTLHGKVHGFEP